MSHRDVNKWDKCWHAVRVQSNQVNVEISSDLLLFKNKFILKSHRLEYLGKYELSLRCYGDLLKSHVCEVSFPKRVMLYLNIYFFQIPKIWEIKMGGKKLDICWHAVRVQSTEKWMWISDQRSLDHILIIKSHRLWYLGKYENSLR